MLKAWLYAGPKQCCRFLVETLIMDTRCWQFVSSMGSDSWVSGAQAEDLFRLWRSWVGLCAYVGDHWHQGGELRESSAVFLLESLHKENMLGTEHHVLSLTPEFFSRPRVSSGSATGGFSENWERWGLEETHFQGGPAFDTSVVSSGMSLPERWVTHPPVDWPFSFLSQLSYSVQVLANYLEHFIFNMMNHFHLGPCNISICLSERISNRASVCFPASTAAAACLPLIGFLWYNTIFSGTLLSFCQTTKNCLLTCLWLWWGWCRNDKIWGLVVKQLIKKLALTNFNQL